MNSGSKLLHNDYLGLLLRLFLGVVFVYASIDKIVLPAQFARIIYNYHLVPAELVNIIALLLPWIELVCGVVLILGIYKQGSVLIINLMLVVFAVAVGINMFRGVDLECGCFTVSSKAKSNALVFFLRDLGLLAIGIYLTFNRSTRFNLIKSRS
ncbi:MAG: DoxX family membrane protein [Candidatus Zixiibacteriota bacterium]|nr:MAG: DoxX family membrane protein [candidate division Zixibacteria bacterium]